jgi:ATP-binding cassette, subfamily B, bacterial PglK
MQHIRNFMKVIRILTSKERKQLLLSLGVMILSGLVDMVGVMSMIPFLTAIADLNNIENVEYLAWIYKVLGIGSTKVFLVVLAAMSFLLLVLNNSIRVFSLWVTYWVSMNLWHSLHVRVFQYYLEQSYTFYMEKNSSDLIDNIRTRVNSVVSGVITPILLMVAHGITGILIIGLLLWQDFTLTMCLVAVLALFYLIIYRSVHERLAEYGKISAELSPVLMKLAYESFAGIKELKVLGRGSVFLRRFSEASWAYSKASLKTMVTVAIPTSLVEIMAIGTILLIGSYLIFTYNDLGSILPILGVYIVASRRIQPALSNLFLQVGQLHFYKPSFDLIWPDVEGACSQKPSPERIGGDDKKVDYKRDIEIANVEFAYNTDSTVINNLSLTIPALSTIGIAGGSGMGKTTLVDLILGLLQPAAGTIRIDEELVTTDQQSELSKHIGYVPQSVFLADDTIKNNIAFGLEDEEIDDEAVRKAAELAQIQSYIENELPEQYDTYIGERGVRLSGGQCQRLGIARALYQDPEILVLDEATSALDGITEQDFMKAVRGLSSQKTIIIIAHRLTTLKGCDEIFLLDKGRVADRGTYEDLMDRNAVFANMANETGGQ